MILNKFGTGWKELFEKRLEYVNNVIAPDSIKNIERYRAMLRIKFESLDNDLQYVLDCVSYKIERESAITCERCGSYGSRRLSDLLPEPICLCLTCYTLEVDTILSEKNS